MRSVDPNVTFIVEGFAREFNTLHVSCSNLWPCDVPDLRFGSRKFDRRKGISFVRVKLVVVLGKLEWIERVVSKIAREANDATPFFWVGKVRRELIDKARTLLQPECFVPQVSVGESGHWLINVAEAKNENVLRLFCCSPENRHQHLAIASWNFLDNWRPAFTDLFPKTIKRTLVAGLEPILKSLQPRT